MFAASKSVCLSSKEKQELNVEVFNESRFIDWIIEYFPQEIFIVKETVWKAKFVSSDKVIVC